MINIFEDGEMKPINSYAFQPGTFVAPLAENANHANTANIAAKVTDKATTESGNKVASYNTPGWYNENWVVDSHKDMIKTIDLGSPGIYIFTALQNADWSEDISAFLSVLWTSKDGTKHSLFERGTMINGGGTGVSAPIDTVDGKIQLSMYNYSGGTHTYMIRVTWLKLGD